MCWILLEYYFMQCDGVQISKLANVKVFAGCLCWKKLEGTQSQHLQNCGPAGKKKILAQRKSAKTWMEFVKNSWYKYKSVMNQYFVEDEHMWYRAYGQMRF